MNNYSTQTAYILEKNINDFWYNLYTNEPLNDPDELVKIEFKYSTSFNKVFERIIETSKIRNLQYAKVYDFNLLCDNNTNLKGIITIALWYPENIIEDTPENNYI